jgi:hypothetical protein
LKLFRPDEFVEGRPTDAGGTQRFWNGLMGGAMQYRRHCSINARRLLTRSVRL